MKNKILVFVALVCFLNNIEGVYSDNLKLKNKDMINKVKNIYLCDTKEDVQKLTWWNHYAWGIIFECDNWNFYNYSSTDVMFPFSLIKK